MLCICWVIDTCKDTHEKTRSKYTIHFRHGKKCETRTIVPQLMDGNVAVLSADSFVQREKVSGKEQKK